MRVLAPAFIAAMALAVSAQANTIVKNGGFETDVLSQSTPTISPPANWTTSAVTDAVTSAIVTDVGADNAFPHTGSNDAFFGDGTLSQSLTLISGQKYTVSFFVGVTNLEMFLNDSSSFDATLGGIDLLSGGIAPDALTVGTYTQFTATVTASSTTETLSFTGLTPSDSYDWYLDDVSVTQQAGNTPVPEPASALLFAAAAGLLSMVRPRRT